MAKLYNLARMTTATTGTGIITLGSAVTGFLSFAAAGVGDGETVTYAIQDGAASEIGRGVYTSSGTTLTRSVLKSTNGGNAINLSGQAQVFVTVGAEDFNALPNTLGAYNVSLAAGTNVTANRTLTLTTGDANRTLTISADATVSQDYSTTGNPQFATIELGHASDTTIARSAPGVVSVEGVNLALDRLLQSGVGAVARTINDKLTDVASVLDYIPVQYHAAIRNNTSTTPVGSYIQLALDANISVHFPPGTYLIDGTTLQPINGQRIYGPGIVKKTTNTVSSPFFLLENKNNVAFDGVQFATDWPAREYCIYTRDTTDVLVTNCTFGDNTDASPQGGGCSPIFLARNTNRVSITNSTFRYGLGSIATGGDPLAGSSTIDGPVTDTIICNNYFDSPDNEALDVNWDTQRLLFSNNIIMNGGRRGDSTNEVIDIGGSIDGTGSICSDIIVCNNYIGIKDTSSNSDLSFRTQSDGILVKQYSTRVRVFGNVFVGSAQTNTVAIGASFSNPGPGCEIYDNTFIGFARGLYAISNGGPVDSCSMRNNRIINATENGLILFNISSADYTNLDFTGNIINGNSATGTAISLRDCRYVDISQTTVNGGFAASSPNGVAVNIGSDCFDVICNDSVLVGCRIGIFVGGTRSQIANNDIHSMVQQGIWIQATDANVVNNRVQNCSTTAGSYGIFVSAGSSRLVLSGNSLDDNQDVPTMRGFQFQASDECLITNNLVGRFLTTSVTGLNLLTNTLVAGNSWSQPIGWQTISTDANVTLTPYSNAEFISHSGTLTANRTVTLSTTNAVNGFTFRIVRVGSGAFNLDIGGLVNLLPSTYCEVSYNGSAWVLQAFGSLTTLPVALGGTGRSTGTTAYALIATGTTATGAQQTLASGATTEILVGGGASALPVWTTATGSGAPVRATSPALVTPTIGGYTVNATAATTLSGGTTREVLTANRTYYVRTDGNDSNNGLANTSGGAFKTIQKAIDVVGGLDVSIYDVTIQVADGTYADGQITIKNFTGSGTATLLGNTSDLTKVICQYSGSGDTITLTAIRSRWTIKGLKIEPSSNQQCVGVRANSSVILGANNYSATTSHHIFLTGLSFVNITESYSVSGGGATHIRAENASVLQMSSGLTTTISNTPAFSSAWAYADRTSTVIAFSQTYSGSATGSRFYVANGSLIFTNGGGASYFPGNSAGTGTNYGASPYGMYV